VNERSFLALRIAFLLVKLSVFLLAVWLAGATALYGIMRLPPSAFCFMMGKIPQSAMPIALGVLPFPWLWSKARAGSLEVGSVTPDFELRTHDRSATVRLSSNRGVRPVVLIFGSYT
jgi:hypothetical protein